MKLFAVAASAALGLTAANNEWQQHNGNGWSTQKWAKPQKYEVEYGYDTAFVKFCDHNNFHKGKYQCVRSQEDKHDDLCRFSYVEDCDRNDKEAKVVRKFFKKIYYDESFEQECNNNPHYWYSDYVENRWHRSLQATAASEAGEPVMRAKGTNGLRNDGWGKQGKHNWQQCPCPEQPYVEYGFDELHVSFCDDKDYHTGKFHCVKAEDDNYEGLCRYNYVKECDKDCGKQSKKVRRYWKKVYFDESFERDCQVNHHYFGNGWNNWQGGNEWNSWQGNDWNGGHGQWTNVWNGDHNNNWNSWSNNNNWSNNGWNNWGKQHGDNWQGNNNWQQGWQPQGWKAPGRALSGQGQDNWNTWGNNQQWNGWQAQRWNNWQGNQWNNNQWNNNWQQGNNWQHGNNGWAVSQSCNSWQPNCFVPSQPRYEYGYDLLTVTLCDEQDYHQGEYACVKSEDDKHDDLCRYHYVKRCEKDKDCEKHKETKTVKLFWKKTYFDREFENECKSNGHFWNGWSHNNNWQQNNGWNHNNNWQQDNKWQQENKWSGK